MIHRNLVLFYMMRKHELKSLNKLNNQTWKISSKTHLLGSNDRLYMLLETPITRKMRSVRNQ
jgi:hypothetical protein